MILLLTGDRRTGKSSACARLVEMGRRAGKRIGGVLAPAISDAHGVKAGIALVDLATGEQRVQASLQDDLGGPRLGPHSMDPNVLAWGTDALIRHLTEGYDLVVVDEIGPLELNQGGGFAPILPALAHAAGDVLIVIRRSLLAELQRRLEPACVHVAMLDRENRDRLPRELATLLWGTTQETP